MDTKEINEIEDKCLRIVAEVLGLKDRDVLPTSNFKDDLGADSLDAVEIIIKTENSFDIALQEGEADNVETVNDYIELVLKKVSETGGTE